MTIPADIFEASSIVWPLVGILFGLIVLKKVKDDVRPIFIAMTEPLKKQAQTNAVAWAIGLMLGVLSSLQALTEVAQQMHWVWVGILCKVLGPGFATIVALVTRSPAEKTPIVVPSAQVPNGSTAASFPTGK